MCPEKNVTITGQLPRDSRSNAEVATLAPSKTSGVPCDSTGPPRRLQLRPVPSRAGAPRAPSARRCCCARACPRSGPRAPSRRSGGCFGRWDCPRRSDPTPAPRSPRLGSMVRRPRCPSSCGRPRRSCRSERGRSKPSGGCRRFRAWARSRPRRSMPGWGTCGASRTRRGGRVRGPRPVGAAERRRAAPGLDCEDRRESAALDPCAGRARAHEPLPRSRGDALQAIGRERKGDPPRAAPRGASDGGCARGPGGRGGLRGSGGGAAGRGAGCRGARARSTAARSRRGPGRRRGRCRRASGSAGSEPAAPAARAPPPLAPRTAGAEPLRKPRERATIRVG